MFLERKLNIFNRCRTAYICWEPIPQSGGGGGATAVNSVTKVNMGKRSAMTILMIQYGYYIVELYRE